VKILCEQKLISLCDSDTFPTICEAANLYNAKHLKEYCAWFQRINPTVTASTDSEMSEFSFLKENLE